MIRALHILLILHFALTSSFAMNRAEMCKWLRMSAAFFEHVKGQIEYQGTHAEAAFMMRSIAQSGFAPEPKEKADLAIELLKRRDGATAKEKAELWELFTKETHTFLTGYGGEFVSNPYPTTEGNFVFAGKEIDGHGEKPNFVPILIIYANGEVIHGKISPEEHRKKTPVDPNDYRTPPAPQW